MDSAPSHALPSGLIHDLRTPLNHIIGYSEMLIDQAKEGGHENSLPDLELIRTAGAQLLAIMSDNFFALSPTKTSQALAEQSTARATQIEQAVATQALVDYAAVEARAAKIAKGSCLVVDDNAANRDLLVRRLEADGYAASPALDGRQALDMLRAQAFDLVLLDIMMPEVDGYEVLRAIMADDRLRHIPVIMISALNELDGVARCIEMGAEDYLPKPFNPTLLRARIGACLEKKRSRDREIALFDQLQLNYKRLQELEKLRDDLTHLIVHDLRTALTSVISGMQTLNAIGDLTLGQREVMGIAVSGGETLLGMINDLLDVETLESDAPRLDYALLSADGLVTAAVAQVEALAAEKKLSLVRAVAPDLSALQGDERKLVRCLVNLLGNAIKFTPAGGTVTVQARLGEDAPSVEFTVIDTGDGIPATALERIFEKFGQVDSRKGGRNMSTGLGLTFCKLAVEAHGGKIEVESAIGKGSKFRMTIPLATPANAAQRVKVL
ncbi:MAG: hybrid sensor histidine kinase/response regulator [Fimbriimonadaceae bacterium]